MDYISFGAQHLDGVIRLTDAEDWASLGADRARALRMLTAPGVVTVVALHDGEVVGFARALSDGELVACLTDIAVSARHRREGLGRRLIDEIFARTGAERMDLLSVPGAEVFYRSLPHRPWAGYRVYPSTVESPHGREG
jgi:predicted N-acetyltransferase YhbS